MATLIIHKENAHPSVKGKEQDRIRRRLDQDLKKTGDLHLVPEILLSGSASVRQPPAWRGPCGELASCLVRRWPGDGRIHMSLVPSFHCSFPFFSSSLWRPILSLFERAPAGMASPLGVAAVHVLLMVELPWGRKGNLKMVGSSQSLTIAPSMNVNVFISAKPFPNVSK